MKTTLILNNEELVLDGVQKKPTEVRFTLNGKDYVFFGRRLSDGSFVLDEETKAGWQRVNGTAFSLGKGAFRVQVGNHEAKISPVIAGGSGASSQSQLLPTAPMPGLVRQILVKVGEKVQAGHPLVVMEAMKLQTTLTAGGNGVVEAILVKEGQQVTEGAELVRIKA